MILLIGNLGRSKSEAPGSGEVEACAGHFKGPVQSGLGSLEETVETKEDSCHLSGFSWTSIAF